MEDHTKGDLIKKVHDLETEGKIVNKLKQNKNSFHVSRDIVDTFTKNILEKTPTRFHDRSFDIPTVNLTDSQSLSNSSCRKFLNSSIPVFDIITIWYHPPPLFAFARL